MINDIIKKFRVKYLQLRGQRMLLRGRVDKAENLFQKALILDSSDANIYNISLCYLAQQKYAEAEIFLEKIEKNYYNSELLYIAMLRAKMMQRKWTESQVIVEKINELKPDLATIKNYKVILNDSVAREKFVRSQELEQQAQVLVGKKKYEEALASFNEALEFVPDEPNVLNNIGSLLLLMGKPPEQALKYFEHACKIAPHSKKFQQNLYIVKEKIMRKKK